MLYVDPDAQALRLQRSGYAERRLIWVRARDRATLATVGVGLWNDRHDRSFTVTDLFTGVSETRLFYGSGGLIDIGPIRYSVGLDVNTVEARLSPLSPQVETLLRGYDVWGAQVQLWNQTFDPDTLQPVGAPERLFKGQIDTADIPRPRPGGDATMSLTMLPAIRSLSIAGHGRKSHATQQKRDGADNFRLYRSIAGEIQAPWGEEDGRGETT